MEPNSPGSIPQAPPPATAPGGGALVRRIVVWENGVPVVANVPMLTKSQTNDIILAAASQPYVPLDPLSPDAMEFDGATCMEVMITKLVRRAAQTGDRGDIEDILDRVLGKPKFTGEVLNVNKSYEDAVRDVERKEAERLRGAIPGSIVPSVEDPLSS